VRGGGVSVKAVAEERELDGEELQSGGREVEQSNTTAKASL
jgi:hypothetical protein